MYINKFNRANRIVITFFNNVKIEIDKINHKIIMHNNHCDHKPDIVDVTQECLDMFHKYDSDKSMQSLKGGIIFAKMLLNKSDFECNDFLYGISKVSLNDI